jgi:hypothetical protein
MTTAKLNPVDATRIAKLFNQIAVSHYMRTVALHRREMGELTTAEYCREFDLWRQHEHDACVLLHTRYGIAPIGYENVGVAA